MLVLSRCVGAFVVLGCLVVVAGCQQTITIGLVNECRGAVEAEIAPSRRASGTDVEWTRIPAGQRDTVRPLSDHEGSVYVMVRTPGAQSYVHASVMVDNLPDADSAKYDEDVGKEVALTGSRCPG